MPDKKMTDQRAAAKRFAIGKAKVMKRVRASRSGSLCCGMCMG